MKLIDRYILARFLGNFLVLFVLLFVFAASIDLILNLDEFVKVARRNVGPDGGQLHFLWSITTLTVNFHGPRLFQFYAYLHGMIAIGAMGFTLAQMYRHKELVAIMASGVSLHRVAVPFVVGLFGLSLLQLVNQEITLPRIAPLILRGHTEIGQRGIEEFAIPLTRDGAGSVMQAPNFDPQRRRMDRPTIIRRDERGLTTERITAEYAEWDDGAGAWRLINGKVMRPGARLESIELYASDLDPESLIVRRHGEYAAMLSMRQLAEMEESKGVLDIDSIARHRYSRFAAVLLNVMILLITIPSYLLREPSSLIRQSIICAAISIPAMLLAIVMMSVQLPGLSPAASVFIPVILLLPIVLFRITYIRT